MEFSRGELDASAGAGGFEGEEELAHEEIGGRVGPSHSARVGVGLEGRDPHLPVLARASAALVGERARNPSLLLRSAPVTSTRTGQRLSSKNRVAPQIFSR